MPVAKLGRDVLSQDVRGIFATEDLSVGESLADSRLLDPEALGSQVTNLPNPSHWDMPRAALESV